MKPSLLVPLFGVILVVAPFVYAGCLDRDNDGYGVSGDCPYSGLDCADYNASIHPGAHEICNLRDDDCNGIVDDIQGNTDPDITRCHCTGLRLPVNEKCNGIDDNCNNKIDEGCQMQIAKPTARVAQPVSPTQNLLVSIIVILGIMGILLFAFFAFKGPGSPEELAAYYHKKGELAYERGKFDKAKDYFNRAADIRRRNI